MFLRVLKVFLVVLLSCSLSGLAQAKTPEEECNYAEEAGLNCKVCGDCAVVFTREGERLCKQCGEYECNLTECSQCLEPECATKE